MTRRTGLMALFAIAGEIIRGNTADAQSLTLRQPSRAWVAEELTITLGGGAGYQRFSFVLGAEKVTITAEELMAALKAER